MTLFRIFYCEYEIVTGRTMSTNGGLHSVFVRGMSIGCTAMQAFVKNSNQWHSRPCYDEGIQNYKTEDVKARIAPVITHAVYLSNLCAVSAQVLHRSWEAWGC